MYLNQNPQHVLPALGMVAVLFVGVLGMPQIAIAEAKAEPAGSYKQKFFRTPDDAVRAVLDACRSNDVPALLDIFGDEYKGLIDTDDHAGDRQRRREFYELARETKRLVKESDGRMILSVGKDAWPFPIPLVREPDGWRFDTAAGQEEIINRRIGENELDTIAICRAYVTAQLQYASRDRDGDEVLEYAQRIASTKGKKDGLYWEVERESGDELSPFGPLVIEAGDYMDGRKAGDPFKGYYYKVLTRQGRNPPGGKYDYIINGNMIAGFALVAFPADYGVSGVMTFVVSHQGKVYEKDLGEKTAGIVKKMKEYDPDKTWTEAPE